MSVTCIVPCIAWLAVLATGSPRITVEYTEDSLAVVKKNIAEGKAVLVDVRSQEEWNQGNIEGAIFLPVTSLRKGGDPAEIAKTLPKEKILYTFCVVGMRAKQAAKVLIPQGYMVRALKPGYEELLEAGFQKAERNSDDETP